MTSSEQNAEQVFPYYRSPASIRAEVFSHRRRGLDEDEVRDYLDLLADQVQTSDNERRDLKAENDRLQAELKQLRAKVEELQAMGDRVNEHAVELFSQAQLVAEEMVEDVNRDARQRLGQAREQERRILEEAMATAEKTRRDAEAMLTRTAPAQQNGMMQSYPSFGGPGGPEVDHSASAELEEVRSFARVAQAQMQSIMDSLAAQVAQLGGSSPRGHEAHFPTQQRNGSSAEDGRGWQIEDHRRDRQDPWGSG